eukprot:130473-Heterocapsa_arctica.AAC.1
MRHDNNPFDRKTDKSRINLAAHYTGLHGLLVEVRGDWKQLKEVFRFPQFNEVAGICWLCTATPRNWRDNKASWRRDAGRL